MPTYTYECKKCGATQDKFHGMNAKPRVRCEDCGGTTKRLMGTGSGIIFKGSGFYETDYKTKTGSPPTSESESHGAGKESSGKSESSKSDSSKSSTSTQSDSKSTASTSSGNGSSK